jgi:hypothetical protein
MSSPDRKGKPFERMGHKTADLRVTRMTYGGWVAEVRIIP